MLSRLDRLGDVPVVAMLPSPHPLPGRPFPPDVTDNRVLWDLDARSYNALFGAALNIHRASLGQPPVDNVRDHVWGRATTRTRSSSRP
ncbi:hypothetical protein [Micromonospora sp. RTP1Z1]|uniref:hypothetical protein n=1 Tax=Micromonospora sp. RTP1Z1 TaxID=2994043 RepID=UPI0029C623A1|nr:hypothetical protein [Micromonospora sp. RTP1Z1]